MLDRALVVVDMQNDFVYGPLGNEDCRSAVKDVVDVITNGGFGLIVVTMDTHDEGYLSTQEGIRLPVEHCIEGTEGWELVPDVECALEESGAEVVTVRKGVFGSVDLPGIIASRCKEDAEVYFVGVCTDICVVSNAVMLRSVCPEMRLAVISSACAGSSRQRHEAALDTMRSCQIDVV